MTRALTASVIDRGESDLLGKHVETYRTYSLIAGLLVILFWALYRFSTPFAVDPLWLRLLLTGLFFGVYVTSFTSTWVQEYFVALMHTLLYGLTLWVVWLSAANDFSLDYAMGLLFAVSAIAVGISTGLQSIGPLRIYLITAMALATVAIVMVPAVVEPAIFLACLGSMGLVIHVATSAAIRAQSRLRHSELKYRRLFSAASDAILVIEPSDRVILDANRKAVDLYGYPREMLIGLGVERLSDTSWLDIVPLENREVIHRRKDGSAVHVLISTAEIDYGDQRVYLSINRDMTERVQTMESLSRANAALVRRTQDLQAFATAASHDLQEPIRKIRTFADLIRHDYMDRLDDIGQGYLDRIYEIGDQMSRIIQDLVVFSAIPGEKDFREVDLGSLVREAVDDLSPDIDRLGARVEVDPLPRVEAASSQVRDLFRHLIANALQARRDGITPLVQVKGHVVESTCRVTISDNGIGIGEHHFEKIFSPFRHLSTPGRTHDRTGMGLAICKRIVEHHGGKLHVTSQVGEGSTFTVELPIRRNLSLVPIPTTTVAETAAA